MMTFHKAAPFKAIIDNMLILELETVIRDGEPRCSIHLSYSDGAEHFGHMLLDYDRAAMSVDEFDAYVETLIRDQEEGLRGFLEHVTSD